MEALYLLVPLSVLIIFIAIYVFFSMSDSGQFDDMVGPALRILQDDDLPADTDTDSKENHESNGSIGSIGRNGSNDSPPSVDTGASPGTNVATTGSSVAAAHRNPPGPI
jgi:cbb3-type cytochrome oxidase maturation protein